VTDLRTPRLCLHAIDPAEGERIVRRRAAAGDVWAEDYPFDGDVVGVTAFLQATAARGDQRPFGHYRITRTADGRAIGGIGFKGRPDGGCVEVGYGLSPSARGHGYAAEALGALLTVAAAHGLSRVVADTTGDNVASRRTLERAGFRHLGDDGRLCRYEVLLLPLAVH
jgi:RimJ/RimL family protein N-acetyltransferase